MIKIFFVALLLFSQMLAINAVNLKSDLLIAKSEQTAITPKNADLKKKIKTLNSLIKKANRKGINTLKEQTTIRTAEIFMTYADYDEAHPEIIKKACQACGKYKNQVDTMISIIPSFERNEINKMLLDSQKELQDVIDGKIKRLESPKLDWSKLKVDNDAILYNGKPVFLADWTWKPRTDEYNEFHGDLDGFLITPKMVNNSNGDITPYIITKLKNKESGSLGFIFINNTTVPSWAVQKDPKIKEGPGIKYTMYDINSPTAHEMMSYLIKGTVPYMKGKKYSQLGYMLCNEPHWNTIKNSWASSPFSDAAYDAFKKWLKKYHKNIETLNKLWGTDYNTFEAIDGPKIMTDEQRGTAQYFDFMLFNQKRVTDWYKFLKKEIRKYDPEAKTHIKIMPNLWTDEKRDSGIDLESLTRMSDIIGNDASSCGKWYFGKPHFWEKNYSFDIVEMTMGYDFMKSVSPDKLIFNTEGHFLSTGKYRNLYQTKEYANCNYWLATIQGLTASQTWYWSRRTDGSARSTDSGYMGSNNYQPRVVNAVHTTMLDLNSVGSTILAFQRERKPLRIFYSKATAINQSTYMRNIFDTYEASYYRGYSVGFATSGILKETPEKDFDVVVVAATPMVFESDIQALQNYLNMGGTVIVDAASLKTNEYGQALKHKLVQGNGSLIVVVSSSDAVSAGYDVVEKKEGPRPVIVQEKTEGAQKTCNWRVIPDSSNKSSYYVNIVNLGKTAKQLSVVLNGNKKPKSIINVLTGEKFNSNDINLPVYGVYLLEVK